MPRYRITFEAEIEALRPEDIEEIITRDLLGIWLLEATAALISRQVETGMIHLPVLMNVELLAESQRESYEAEDWTPEQWRAALSDEEIVEEPYEEDAEGSG